MDRITARYHWSYELHALGLKLHQRTRKKERMAAYILIPVLLLVIVGAAAWEGNLQTTLIVAGLVSFLGIIAGFFMFCLIGPYLKRHEFHQLPGAETHVEWCFTGENITISNIHGTQPATWAAFHGVYWTRYGFLVLAHPKVFYLIPLNAFNHPEEIEAVKASARQHARFYRELE